MNNQTTTQTRHSSGCRTGSCYPCRAHPTSQVRRGTSTALITTLSLIGHSRGRLRASSLLAVAVLMPWIAVRASQMRSIFFIVSSEASHKHKEWPEARPRRREGTEETRRRGNVDLAILTPVTSAVRPQQRRRGALEHAVTRTRHTGIKLAYARHDLVRGRVFVKHLNDPAITSPGQAQVAMEGDDQESSGQSLEVPAGNERELILISVTQGGLGNSYVSLAGNLGFFPQDSLGPSNLGDGEATMLTLHFAGLDGTHQTDIASNYPGFRRRGPWSRFFAHHQIAAGDVVAIERLSRYEYQVLPLIQPRQER